MLLAYHSQGAMGLRVMVLVLPRHLMLVSKLSLKPIALILNRRKVDLNAKFIQIGHGHKKLLASKSLASVA